MAHKKLRLILGDQLNHQHSWLQEVNNDTLYVMMEVRQETDYVKHHIQKVIAFFRSTSGLVLRKSLCLTSVAVRPRYKFLTARRAALSGQTIKLCQG